jgi:hypothetical protein
MAGACGPTRPGCVKRAACPAHTSCAAAMQLALALCCKPWDATHGGMHAVCMRSTCIRRRAVACTSPRCSGWLCGAGPWPHRRDLRPRRTMGAAQSVTVGAPGSCASARPAQHCPTLPRSRHTCRYAAPATCTCTRGCGSGGLHPAGQVVAYFSLVWGSCGLRQPAGGGVALHVWWVPCR